MTALGLAAKEDREQAVTNTENQTEECLWKVGAQVTKEEAQDLLWKGIERNDMLEIKIAFLLGADLEERRRGWTPLTKASELGRLEAVRALVKLGAGLEGRGGVWRGTALYWASGEGHESVVRLLLEAGASLEAEGKFNYRPLHRASADGQLPIVKLLVEAGANVRAEDEDRWTPLHMASTWGPLSTVKVLVEAGADINHRTKGGYTPLALAEVWGHPAIEEYLHSLGATT